MLSDSDFDTLISVGRDVLLIYPDKPGACFMMSALYAGHLATLVSAPVKLIAGDLSIKGNYVFGGPRSAMPTFEADDHDWDGHAWITFGEYIADVSIFRTGFSPKSPPLLARHLAKSGFNRRSGLYIATSEEAAKDGFDYHARKVCGEEVITTLYRSAMTHLS